MPVQGPGLLTRTVLTMDVQQAQHSIRTAVNAGVPRSSTRAIMNVDMWICQYVDMSISQNMSHPRRHLR
jgi:hypothetical protein